MTKHAEVAHHWANQTGLKTSAGSVFYNGDTIYSYGKHFPIARIMPDRNVVLFTTAMHSGSTSAHKGIARDAIDKSRYAICDVANVLAKTKEDHANNYRGMIHNIGDMIGKATRARFDATRGGYIKEAERLHEAANAYRELFRIRLPALTDLESVNVEMTKLRKSAARAARAAEKREAEQRRLAAKATRQRLRDWLHGADIFPPRTHRPYVRVKDGEVETTWGASIDLADGLAVYEQAKACRAAGTGFAGGEEKVGHFRLDAIDSVGGIKIGCHHVPFRYARLAACLAGIDQPGTEA